MDKLIKPGRTIFAFAMLALGALSISSVDFIVGRPPAWSESFGGKSLYAYVSSIVFMLAALAVMVRFRGYEASILIAAMVFFLSSTRHFVHWMADWVNMFKSFALAGSALIVAASFLKSETPYYRDQNRLRLVTVGCVMVASFFISGGYSHFKYADFVDTLIPDYIPFHSFWTYFCGICLLAGGVGILIPKTRKWAAFSCALMIGGWFLLLHIPRFIHTPDAPSDRMGLCESFCFAGAMLVLAGVSALQEEDAQTRIVLN